MKSKFYRSYFLVFIIIQSLITGCVGKTANDDTTITKVSDFSKGADVSWLPEMEKSGFKFYNSEGNEDDCLQILKDNGINTIRLRTWVNPSDDALNGHCSSAETVKMAVRAKNMGFRIMIDFHYSDSWCDPGKQVKPALWQNHSFTELQKDVYSYTYQVMSDLKSAGVSPEWVQIGNEINPGMMLPEGSSDNMENLSKLINSGYSAVKEINPNCKVIIHLANGTDNGLFRWFFDGLKQYSVKYDVIGMSYYPYWDKKNYKENIMELSTNMNDMVARYGKEIMIVETGGEDTKVEENYNMIKEVIKKVKEIPDEKGIGVIYWEPEGAYVWSKYGLSCWGSDGKPTKVIEGFKE